jgi:hypothetical protein
MSSQERLTGNDDNLVFYAFETTVRDFKAGHSCNSEKWLQNACFREGYRVGGAKYDDKDQCSDSTIQ